MVVPGGLMFYC